MEVNTVSFRDFQVIQSYDESGFRISGQRYDGSVIVFSRHAVSWPVMGLAAATVESFKDLLTEQPYVELMLFGTGRRMRMIPSSLQAGLREAYGLVPEVMDTGAACRTFNVLVAEGRPVAAALLAVDAG
jgi:uncharacterized protein